ncbi:MAG: zf-HC2 domain-containing protein [Planctomycetota bacterium]
MFRKTLKRIDLILNLRCDQHRRLRSDALDRRLVWWERMAVAGHWLVCGPCRKVVRQLRQVDQAARKLVESTDQSLSAEARERIARRLRAMPKSDDRRG